MSISADHSCKDIGVDVRPQGKEDQVTFNGITSKILDHASTPRTADREPLSLSWLHRHPLFRHVAFGSAALLSTLCLSACHMQNSITPNGGTPSDIRLNVFSGDGPVYGHRKKHPQHVYEITIRIDDAPGPFSSFGASVSMQGKNPACGVPHGFPAGTIMAPDGVVPFLLTRISDTEYRGTFATDPLVDEVFWEGRPACEWEFVAVGFGFSATGAEGETGFSGSLDAKELASGRPVKRYYWKGGYPRSISDNFPDGGQTSIEKFKPEIRNNLFTITATAREVRS